MSTLIMHPLTKEQERILKAVAKALKVRFEVSPYDPDFVAMVKKSAKSGKYTEIDTKDVWGSLNIG